MCLSLPDVSRESVQCFHGALRVLSLVCALCLKHTGSEGAAQFQKWELALCPPPGHLYNILFMKETPTNSKHAVHALAAELQLLTGGKKCEDNGKKKSLWAVTVLKDILMKGDRKRHFCCKCIPGEEQFTIPPLSVSPRAFLTSSVFVYFSLSWNNSFIQCSGLK